MNPLRFILLVLLSGGAAWGKTVRFDMRDGLQRNVVQFVSDALLEKVVGLSPGVWGWVELDPQDISKGIKAELEMDLRTFDTGIPARNQHLREKVFFAYEHPVARFTVKRVVRFRKRQLVPLQPVEAQLEGELYFRGQTTTERLPVKLTFMPESDKTRQRLPGNLLKLQGTMDLDLKKYGVEIPDGWHLRFSPRVSVSLDAIGTDHSPAGAPVVLPEGPKPKEKKPEPTASPTPTSR